MRQCRQILFTSGTISGTFGIGPQDPTCSWAVVFILSPAPRPLARSERWTFCLVFSSPLQYASVQPEPAACLPGCWPAVGSSSAFIDLNLAAYGAECCYRSDFDIICFRESCLFHLLAPIKPNTLALRESAPLLINQNCCGPREPTWVTPSLLILQVTFTIILGVP